MSNDGAEKRSEPRAKLEEYHSVEFKIADLGALYQFKIWNTSSKGICVLVREDSNVLKYIEVGNVLDMKYHTSDYSIPPQNLKTQIKHITKEDHGRFKGHYLVGLSIESQRTND
jgi:hypothetical protein